MADLIHTHSARVSGRDGTLYEARVYGEAERGGTWKGWLEFRPASASATGGDAGVLRTGRETTQPDRRAVDYWAGGLQPIYLEGALARAHPER